MAAFTASLPTIRLRTSRTVKSPAGLAGTSLDGAVLALPFLEAAIQHRGVVVAELAQQPPDAGRPPDIGGAVGDHAGAVADAETTHRRGEVLGLLAHEVQLLRGVGDVTGNVAELCAGDVALFEILTPELDHTGDLRVGDQVGRAVQHDDLVEVLG